MKSAKLFQSGQALVLVLLSLAVVLTLVLFVLSRSVTDVAISSREEEAVRAFSAAEAGVEKSLIVGTGFSLTDIGDASFKVDISSLAENSSGFTYPISLNSGETSSLWFVAHDADGNIVCNAETPCFTGRTLKVCWGRSGTPSGNATTPAVELSVFYTTTPGDYSTVRIARGVYDPNTGRRLLNSFESPDGGTCTIGDQSFEFQKTIDLSTLGIPAGSYGSQAGLQVAHIRFFYNTDLAHQVGYDVNFGGNSLLPSQGLVVDSSGEAGQSTRRLAVFQAWPEAPTVFGYSVYSSSGLTQ
jgi:hypothetical protein